MRAAVRLLQSCRITFFTREGCSLCDTAKTVLHQVQTRKAFEMNPINIDVEPNRQWKNVYDYDVPVIHVEALKNLDEKKRVPASDKLMHRFTEQQVEKLMDKVAGSAQ